MKAINIKYTYKACQITADNNGQTFAVEGHNLLGTRVELSSNGHKTLEEAHLAIDEAEKTANDIIAAANELAGKINATYLEVTALNTAAEENGRKAIQKAIKIGEMLIEVKKQLGGSFSSWRTQNCKEICEKTSQNYMRLAKPKPQYVAELNECTSLRQAYIAIGVIKPSKAKVAARIPLSSQKTAMLSANVPTKTITNGLGSTAALPTAPKQATTTSTGTTFAPSVGTSPGVTAAIGMESSPLESLVLAIMSQLHALPSDESRASALNALKPLKNWLESEVFANQA